MAKKIKIKILEVPSIPSELKIFEKDIEKEIEKELDKGYLLDKMTGDGSLILLAFKEE